MLRGFKGAFKIVQIIDILLIFTSQLVYLFTEDLNLWRILAVSGVSPVAAKFWCHILTFQRGGTESYGIHEIWAAKAPVVQQQVLHQNLAGLREVLAAGQAFCREGEASMSDEP